MRGLVRTDGVTLPSTGWTALLFGSRTRTKTELTSE